MSESQKITNDGSGNTDDGGTREDILFRKTKIICTLGKLTSNLVSVLFVIFKGSNMQNDQ